MRPRMLFLGAIVVVLLLGPVIALLGGRGGGGGGGGGARDAARTEPRSPVAVAQADVPLAEEGDQSPLPKPRPKLVEPVAGETALQAGDATGVAADGGTGGGDRRPTGPASPGGGVSPGAPSDDEVRAELAGMQRSQAHIRTLLASGRYRVNYGSGRVNWPLPSYRTISSPFGMRWGRLHAGIDIPAPVGTPIRTADAGTVILAGWTGGYGNYTCVQHTRTLSTCYGHQSRLLVRAGQDVRAGEAIGLTGNTGSSTGPHLHFETRVGGQPLDPMGFL
jgi:murein DD-endopeptidase MepM/ murein hydrolase activator NlpD